MSKRRSSGEGSVVEYQTKAGPRWWVAYYATNAVTGEKRRVLKRGFTSKKAAQSYLRNEVSRVESGEWVAPSRQTLEEYLSEWLEGQRLKPSTIASYRKNIRLHVNPHLGTVRLGTIRGPMLTAWMRTLEKSGRVDGAGGLSPRTVRYVFTIVKAALGDAVFQGVLPTNPADRAEPPSAAEARPPEMHPWTAKQLQAFLAWCEAPATDNRQDKDPDLTMAWRLLAATGMRRGEALALRWSDIDFDAGRLSVRRTVGLVKHKGGGQQLVEGTPKTGQARVIDLDADTVARLRAYRAARGSVGLALVRDSALVLGRLDTGAHRHPDRFSQRFVDQVKQARRDLGEDALPLIRLHDLRHTHATLLLASGEPVKVVSERLGHATPLITLTVYQHVTPSMGREAADRFAALLGW